MLIISETARLDLLEIFSHIAEDSIDSAHQVITELAKKFDLLEANPQLVVQNRRIKMRWMSPREYARLQGAPDFNIQRGVNQSLTGFGDGVCVPVIEWIDKHILSPVVASYLSDVESNPQFQAVQSKQLTFDEIISFAA